MKEYVVRKCMKCGALVRVIEDCHCDGCGIVCCDEKMTKLKPNSTDGAAEKHLPTYEEKDGKVYVTVNHVMDEDHYIEWISFVYDDIEITTYLTPGKKAVAHGKYVKGMKIYVYCNKHGLWYAEVE